MDLNFRVWFMCSLRHNNLQCIDIERKNLVYNNYLGARGDMPKFTFLRTSITKSLLYVRKG